MCAEDALVGYQYSIWTSSAAFGKQNKCTFIDRRINSCRSEQIIQARRLSRAQRRSTALCSELSMFPVHVRKAPFSKAAPRLALDLRFFSGSCKTSIQFFHVIFSFSFFFLFSAAPAQPITVALSACLSCTSIRFQPSHRMADCRRRHHALHEQNPVAIGNVPRFPLGGASALKTCVGVLACECEYPQKRFRCAVFYLVSCNYYTLLVVRVIYYACSILFLCRSAFDLGTLSDIHAER